MSSYKTFSTQRLLLKPTIEEDADFILELVNTPKWLKFIGDRNIKTAKDAADYIKTKILPQLKKLGYSNYTLIRKEDNSKIGTCGIYDRPGIEGVDLGFAFLPQFEKKGYALEATTKMIEVAFDTFNLTRINAITVKENLASQKLLEKLGMKLKGTTKLQNEKEELLLYQIEK